MPFPLASAIIQDRNSGYYYAGKINGVVQWRVERKEARLMNFTRAWNVVFDLTDADDEQIYSPTVIKIS